MVPILVPVSPLFGDGERAERAVWEALRDQLPDDAVLFHGLRLQERRHEHEADLVVLLPDAGWAVIEVKGGGVRRQDGVWEQRQQGSWHRIDPVAQAQDCRHVLQRSLSRYGSQAEHSRAVHLVALPDRDADANFEAPELPRALLIDRQDLKQVAHRLCQAIDLHGDGNAPLTPAGAVEMTRLLTGPNLVAADIFAFQAQHEERVRQMTQDQTSILGFLRNQHRVAVIGGAGSGKTWLALEQTRLLAKAGQSVALVCYSRGLAHFLERVVAEWKPTERPSYVGLFHDLPVKWGAPLGEENDSAWFEEELPSLLGDLAAKRIAQVFGSLGVEQSKYEGLEGPPVRFVACSSDDAIDRADTAVEHLTQVEGWPPGSVALLTTNHRHPVQTEMVEGVGWDGYWDDFFAAEDVFYGHVLGFKGLERPVVVLAVNGFRDVSRAREMLYVGLSRARTQLVVCGDPDLIAKVGGEGVRRRLTT